MFRYLKKLFPEDYCPRKISAKSIILSQMGSFKPQLAAGARWRTDRGATGFHGLLCFRSTKVKQMKSRKAVRNVTAVHPLLNGLSVPLFTLEPRRQRARDCARFNCCKLRFHCRTTKGRKSICENRHPRDFKTSAPHLLGNCLFLEFVPKLETIPQILRGP